MLFALGLDKPAEAAWQHALTLDPTHKSPTNSMVQRTRTGRADEAIPLGKRLVATYPMYIEGWDGLAAAYLAVQDGQGARVAAERAVALSPHRASSWCNQGSASFLEQDFACARTAWERCASLDPNNPYPRRGLEALDHRAP